VNPMAYALALGLLVAISLIVWFFFMAPLGRERHARELEMIRRKLERLEAGRQSADDSSERGDRQQDIQN